jgi:hypothetical protein
MHTKALLARSLVLALALTAATGALAGQQTGQITELITRASDGLVYVHMNGTASGRPGCASQQVYWMIKDENSAAGKRQLAILIAARAMGKTITIYGAGTCTRWPDGEDINEISF